MLNTTASVSIETPTALVMKGYVRAVMGTHNSICSQSCIGKRYWNEVRGDRDDVMSSFDICEPSLGQVAVTKPENTVGV